MAEDPLLARARKWMGGLMAHLRGGSTALSQGAPKSAEGDLPPWVKDEIGSSSTEIAPFVGAKTPDPDKFFADSAQRTADKLAREPLFQLPKPAEPKANTGGPMPEWLLPDVVERGGFRDRTSAKPGRREEAQTREPPKTEVMHPTPRRRVTAGGRVI